MSTIPGYPRPAPGKEGNQGMSKERAAKIANTPGASRKGGKAAAKKS